MKKTLKRRSRVEAITTTTGLKTAISRSDDEEWGMLRFRQMKSLQKFTSVHGGIHNHFNQKRHLIDRQSYEERRLAAPAEWQSLAS